VFNKLPYSGVLDATILFMRELKAEDKNIIRNITIMSSNYSDRDKKFMLKTTLYDIFWQVPLAVDKGFSIYLDNKINYYYHLSKYHEKNCVLLDGKKECKICNERKKNIDYLFGEY